MELGVCVVMICFVTLLFIRLAVYLRRRAQSQPDHDVDCEDGFREESEGGGNGGSRDVM